MSRIWWSKIRRWIRGSGDVLSGERQGQETRADSCTPAISASKVSSPAPIYLPSTSGAPAQLRQGEILSNIIQTYLDLKTLGREEISVLPKIHPYTIILSQDCDMEQDFKARRDQDKRDKLIPNILFCEVVTAEQLKQSPGGMNSSIWGRVKVNKDERYQFLQRIASAQDAMGEGLPELAVDFKRYFTIPADEVYRRVELGEALRRCVLSSPSLEHFCSRFAYYLSRVALPLDHLSE